MTDGRLAGALVADRRAASYVLPLRRADSGARDGTAAGLGDLVDYLRWLSSRVEVVVVDGTPGPLEPNHPLRRICGLTYVTPEHLVPNGKVAGVLTGLSHARHERIIIADDDVRYDQGTLDRVLELLDHADLVRPQNVFHPMPWHARWDTGRSLLNRVVGGDYPGTLAVRRSVLTATQGYCGAVLFENLQLIRTVSATSARMIRADGVFVSRRPPSVRKFWEQRVRQAFDSFAQPARLAVELALVPGMVFIGRHSGIRALAAAGLLAVTVAEVGRRRSAGRAVYPPDTSWWAAAWVVERGICSWLAVLQLLRHNGVDFGGVRLRTAATSRTAIRRNLCPTQPCACKDARAPLAHRGTSA